MIIIFVQNFDYMSHFFHVNKLSVSFFIFRPCQVREMQTVVTDVMIQ